MAAPTPAAESTPIQVTYQEMLVELGELGRALVGEAEQKAVNRKLLDRIAQLEQQRTPAAEKS